MEKKVLTLRCCKHDFTEIVKKWAKFRFLEVKKYWESRILEKNWTPKEFDLIHLKNWYSSDSPLAIIEFKWNIWIFKYEWKDCFKIWLGKVLSLENFEI